MKKIVFVMPKMALGGTEKSLLNLLDKLPQNEYDITVLLFKKEGDLLNQIPEWVKVSELSDYESIKYDFCESPFKLAPKYLVQGKPIRAINILIRHLLYRITNNRYSYYKYSLKKFQYNQSFDTSIAYLGPYDLLTAYVLFCISAKEKVQWIHFDVSKYVFNKKTSDSLYKYYDKINVVSEGARDALISLLPELSAKTFYVENTISEKRCKEMAKSGQGFDDDYTGIRIITIGRLSEEKGQDIIPETAALIKNSGMDFRWYIIGKGELYNSINAKIKDYSVEKQVILLGAKENPYPFFNEADIYVQTSKHEGFGLTLAEAKIFDLSIVSTRCLGADEQLNGLKNTMIIEREANEFANAIIKLSRGINNA